MEKLKVEERVKNKCNQNALFKYEILKDEMKTLC